MSIINGNVTENYSKLPIANLIVTINGNFVTRTDNQGKFQIDIPEGNYQLCVMEQGGEVNYEVNCQTTRVVSNMVMNIQMKPIVSAL